MFSVDTVVIKADALTYGFVHTLPVGFFKAAFGIPAGFAKKRVMPVKALDQREGDLVCIGAIEADRNFHRDTS